MRMLTTAPRLSSAARKPNPICTAYCIASPNKAVTIIHRERSYRLFSHLTCRWESATMKALMSMNMKHANWSRNNESICLQKYYNNFKKRYKLLKKIENNHRPEHAPQYNICISIAQYCELSERRNLWFEILEFWACRCYCAYCQCIIYGDECECAKKWWVKKLHFIPNVLLLPSIWATFAMQLGYSWLANVVLLQCKEAPIEELKSHRRCQTP